MRKSLYKAKAILPTRSLNEQAHFNRIYANYVVTLN